MPTGQDIMVEAGILLHDEGHVRWTLAELCRWINEGVKATVLAKPSASSKSTVVALAAGTLQTVPASALALLGITRNIIAEGPPRVAGRTITPATHADLNAQVPNWHEHRYSPFRKEVRHFIFDENVPREFYVFPGNDGTGKIETLVSELPSPLVASGDPENETSYASSVGLPDPYTVPLTDYVIYRAQAKDDVSGNVGRAQMHFAAFATAVGLKTQVEAATSPNTRGAK